MASARSTTQLIRAQNPCALRNGMIQTVFGGLQTIRQADAGMNHEAVFIGVESVDLRIVQVMEGTLSEASRTCL